MSPSHIDLGLAKRRGVQSSRECVTIAPLDQNVKIPLTIQTSIRSLKVDIWVQDNIETVQTLLRQNGALLFRGFDVTGQEDLQNFTKAMGMQLMEYMEGATPRKVLGNSVFTSTEFPPEHAIALHNENSYVMTWPAKICFCCIAAPQDRGETPIGDVRGVLARIDPSVRRRFESKGYMLVRSFSEHLGLPWRQSFHVSTPEELEEYCRRARIEMEWIGPEQLRTRQVRPALLRHPQTGDELWFNHIAFWHASSLEESIRKVLLAEYSEQGLPYNVFYGDGEPIDDSVVTHLREAYEAETVKFPWQRGDILLLDNMRVAHGRSPFSGPRKILVSMGDPFTRTDC
ncbi:MAG: TauD/TfdA family dioxygenase [Acidobacteriia bacterium]|nr:TauD/TfdA family dioxygenase [Terriglobia bacterium]